MTRPAASRALLAGAAALPLLLAFEADAQTVLRLSHGYELENPHHLASIDAAAHMEACTEGGVRIDIYPASQLGTEAAMNDQVKFGGIDIIQTGLSWAMNDYAPIGVTTLPYLFRDRHHAHAYQQSDVIQELMEGYNEATGLHMLAVGYHGAFNLSSRGSPVNGLDDVQGLKVRVPDTAIFLAFPRAIGANPTPIPFAEVYMGLQQGVADASVNPLPVTYSHKLYEVQDYVALTEHLLEFIAWIVSGPAWDRLDEAERACMREAAEIFAEGSAEGNIELENTLRERMTADGLIAFTTPDKDPFVEATESARQELMAQYDWPDELVERIRAIE